jgi:spermidine synthase
MDLWFTEQHTENVRFSIKVKKQLYSAQSEFQQIDVFDSFEFGRFFTLDGLIMLTEKDEYIYHEIDCPRSYGHKPRYQERALSWAAGTAAP